MPGRPAFNISLSATCHRQSMRRDILSHRTARSNKCMIANLHRSNKIRIAANENIVANLRLMLQFPVIIAGDRAAADIDPLADLRIADITEMRYLAALTDAAFFDLNKMSGLDMVSKDGTGRR